MYGIPVVDTHVKLQLFDIFVDPKKRLKLWKLNLPMLQSQIKFKGKMMDKCVSMCLSHEFNFCIKFLYQILIMFVCTGIGIINNWIWFPNIFSADLKWPAC